MTFGGPHLSAPSFVRAGVRAGDDVIPINVRDGQLALLSRLRVAEVLEVEDFVSRHRDWFDPMRSDAEYQRVVPYLDNDRSRAFWQLATWLRNHPEVNAFCPGEATEVVVAADSVPVQLDRIVPAGIVKALRWQSGRRPERPIKHLSPEGRIERSISLQGIYRLTEDSASLLRPITGDAGAT
jgi:hypothetical protein